MILFGNTAHANVRGLDTVNEGEFPNQLVLKITASPSRPQASLPFLTRRAWSCWTDALHSRCSHDAPRTSFPRERPNPGNEAGLQHHCRWALACTQTSHISIASRGKGSLWGVCVTPFLIVSTVSCCSRLK